MTSKEVSFCAHQVVAGCYSDSHVGTYALMLVPLGTLPCTTPLTVLLPFAFELTLSACRYRLLPVSPLVAHVLAARLRFLTNIAHRRLLVPLVG